MMNECISCHASTNQHPRCETCQKKYLRAAKRQRISSDEEEASSSDESSHEEPIKVITKNAPADKRSGKQALKILEKVSATKSSSKKSSATEAKKKLFKELLEICGGRMQLTLQIDGKI